MFIARLFKLTQPQRNQFCARIIETSSPRLDYYFLVILSSLIVSLGLLADNVVLVIGGMLVTPLLSPLLATALGIVTNDSKMIVRSVRIIFISFLFAFVVAFLCGLMSRIDVSSLSLLRIMEPSLFTFFIALVAGTAASFTWAKPNLNETLPGIAVTVTLIPPLVAVGLALAHAEWYMTIEIFKVLMLNVFGIITASLVIFSLMDFYKAKKKVVESVKLEEKEIKKEKEAAIGAKP